MSAEALAAWLLVRRNQAVQTKSLQEGQEEEEKTGLPLADSNLKKEGNSTIISTSAQPSHHRIFWREETTSTSLWEGTHRAIEAIEAAKRPNATPTPKHGGHENSHQEQEEEHQLRSTEEDGEENPKNNKYVEISDPAFTVLREVSKSSNLRRLARLLAERSLNFGGPETFTVALHGGNPAVVEMILRHEREHGGAAFTRAFRSWAINASDGEQSSPVCLPLHLSCHAGSPEVLSVLLKFIVDFYPVEDRAAMVNARDLNGRSALHLASWSPRPQCPGRRNAMIRNLLAHEADVHAQDKHGRTALHQACRAGDCLSVEILLGAGADPLHADSRKLTPLETANKITRRSLDGVFRKCLPPASYLHLCAAVTSKDEVTRIMRHFEPTCSTCRVRPAAKCGAQKRDNFAAWLFTHKRWPKAEEGKWQEVRPSCVEKKTPVSVAA